MTLPAFPRQARYEVRLFSPNTGLQSLVFNNWHALYYEKWVNNSHNYQLVLPADHPAVTLLDNTPDTIVEVWRRIQGGAWYREISCLHRTDQYALEENGRELYTSFGRGLNDFINRRVIDYYANTAFTVKQGPGDDVIKEIVYENAGPGADNALRRSYADYSAVTYGLDVASDMSLAPVWQGTCTWKNLLDQLLEISLAVSVDFEVLRTGALSFQFQTYYPQRGVDRSSVLLFAPEFNNMTNITYNKSRTEEATVAIVLGQGEESNRRTLNKLSAARLDSRWNVIETTRDARTQPNLADLQSAGDTALEETQAHQTFSFSTLQTSVRQYGRDYNVGDKIKAKYRTVETVKKIITAKVSMAAGKEEINLEFADVVD